MSRNYDLYMGEDGAMFLYLNRKYFWINSPTNGASRARAKLPKGTACSKFGSLRDVALEASEELENPKKKGKKKRSGSAGAAVRKEEEELIRSWKELSEGLGLPESKSLEDLFKVDTKW